MSHADMNNCSGFNEVAAAFSWSSPKKAINPYLDPAEVAPVSALSNLITLYAADNEQEQLRREALSDQVFGIPGRQAYRELRLLAGQAARQQGDKKAGAPVLDNPRLDAILAAADAGCFATYIMKQGGVLVPRKYHLIRTAYEINEEPTAYGDHGIRIYGIWSPIAEGKICTHAVKWKMVRKAVDVQEAAADQGACAPWTRGNNCPLAENLNQQGKDKSADGDTRTDITRMDDKELHGYLHSMSKKERRELAARLRLVKPKRRKDYKQRITDHQRQQLVYELKSRGFNGSEKEVDLLLRGGSIPSGAGLRIFYRNQRLQEDDKWRNLY
ncbi:hypothetical protein HCX12_14210 [Escherichia coli]|nr:hypothetical protein [Escherichia coli]